MPESQIFTAGDGVRLAYRLDGHENAPVAVFANSIATTLRMWDPQIAALSQRRRVLRYDYRGHGGSDIPPGAYSADRLGRDVLELLDHLQIGAVDFVGLSLGGYVGQWLGIHAPARIDRLVLANTAAWLGPAPAWDEQITAIQAASDNTALADAFLDNWFSQTTRATHPDLIAPFREDLLAQSRTGLAGALAVVRDADFRRTDQLISAPTLVLVGEHDTVTTPKHGKEIADVIAHAELQALPGTHLTNAELPNEFDKTLLAFLLR
jgi:3-oxoadipate enol-lactonase